MTWNQKRKAYIPNQGCHRIDFSLVAIRAWHACPFQARSTVALQESNHQTHLKIRLLNVHQHNASPTFCPRSLPACPRHQASPPPLLHHLHHPPYLSHLPLQPTSSTNTLPCTGDSKSGDPAPGEPDPKLIPFEGTYCLLPPDVRGDNGRKG